MELNPILQQIDSLKQEAEKLQPVKPELERVFWDKFRLEFNYNSNHMEGNTLTYGHTQLLLLFDKIGGDNYSLRELEEMKAHDVALKMITEVAADTQAQLTEKFIREINEIILVRPYYNKAITPDGQSTRRLITPGKYKEHPNSVLLPDGGMFYYATPEETPVLMGDLIEWYNQEKDKIHPVELAALFHYKLVRIHPFDDSNGRTTRLLMNYILLKSGYAPVVIESNKKKMYLAALNKADTGDMKAFTDYIAGVSFRWQEIYLKALKGEKIEEPDDFEKEVDLYKRKTETEKKDNIKISEKIINELFDFSLQPLLEKTLEKLSILDRLFEHRDIQFVINGNSFSLTSLDFLWQVLKAQRSKIISGHTLDLIYILRDFLNTMGKKINPIFQLQLRFFDYSYEVFFIHQNELLTIRKYGQQLTVNEINEIAEMAAKKVFDEIKSYEAN
jgi:Fic family protein